ncbi:hypothetical protein EDD22DRAFT_478595 [Suillus occidentalis]|nr:hypothetical protein EDD22DRAFT_478595 [Suillus occidentalis]
MNLCAQGLVSISWVIWCSLSPPPSCKISGRATVGLVVLLWDHLLTVHDEVELVWRAQLSFPKLLFLFNRYVVPTCLIILTYATSGFSDDIVSDSVCIIPYREYLLILHLTLRFQLYVAKRTNMDFTLTFCKVVKHGLVSV